MEIRRAEREITPYYINVVVNGTYTSSLQKIMHYRVKVKIPDCYDLRLKSNLQNRILKNYIINTQLEYTKDGEFKKNDDYKTLIKVTSVNIEKNDGEGNSLIEFTDELPNFYGKSIFKYSYEDIQDIAISFGLHSIKNTGDIEELRNQLFIEYLDKILGINDKQNRRESTYNPDKDIKNKSFYKLDVNEQKYYIDLTDEDVDDFKITNWINLDDKKLKKEKIKSGSEKIENFNQKGISVVPLKLSNKTPNKTSKEKISGDSTIVNI
ncbi:MAG: hypothetical protein LBH46_04355 [Rickettsiales bacterium]|jgi:hypothetical protein|nr:hypothetical protein [Rickettsiales bacterium]